MSLSRKYGANGKTFHVPWSEGTDSTDRKNWEYWDNIQNFKRLVFTEKLDGENNCLNEFGVFARSHAAPASKPWNNYIKERHASIVYDLKRDNIEIFGENMYAVHSIEYPTLESYFQVFAVRALDKWLSWEEVKWWASVFDFQTVPEIAFSNVSDLSEKVLIDQVKKIAEKPSAFGSYDIIQNAPCTMEGVVFRNVEEFPVDAFVQNLFKVVRPSHVKTDEHWERRWKRAFLRSETEAFAKANGITLESAGDYMSAIDEMRNRSR